MMFEKGCFNSIYSSIYENKCLKQKCSRHKNRGRIIASNKIGFVPKRRHSGPHHIKVLHEDQSEDSDGLASDNDSVFSFESCSELTNVSVDSSKKSILKRASTVSIPTEDVINQLKMELLSVDETRRPTESPKTVRFKKFVKVYNDETTSEYWEEYDELK